MVGVPFGVLVGGAGLVGFGVAVPGLVGFGVAVPGLVGFGLGQRRAIAGSTSAPLFSGPTVHGGGVQSGPGLTTLASPSFDLIWSLPRS